MSLVRKRLQTLTSVLGPRLIAVCATSLVLMGLANELPDARNALCEIEVCFRSTAAKWWNKLIYDFSAGTLISIVFFWVLARWPEHIKKMRIKRSFKVQYRVFKRACIENFLAVAGGGFDCRLPDELLTLEAFREYFKQGVGDGKTRWSEVANNMTDYYLDVTLTRMEALRHEITFVMHNAYVDDEKAMEFLKAFSSAMLMQRNATTDYDAIKSFLGFFWQLLAGWDWVEGYRSRDIVEEMIESI